MTTTRDELDTGSVVLSFARDSRVAADRAEVDLLVAAVIWGEQHPPESIHEAATWASRGGDCPLPLAGEGAPLVAEFCIAEFAAIGPSTDSGRAKMAHGLELKYRLPRHWQRTQTGTLEPWRACRIAAATLGLSREAAAYVDAQLVGRAHRVGPVVLDRLVEQAIALHARPGGGERREGSRGPPRHLPPPPVSLNGTTYVQAELDLADALDLDAASTAEAEALRLAGSVEPLDVRRALAAGRLARRQLGLDLDGWSSNERSERSVEATPPTRPAVPKTRQVVLHVHLSEAAITGITPGNNRGGPELAQVDHHHRTVLAEQVRSWVPDPRGHDRGQAGPRPRRAHRRRRLRDPGPFGRASRGPRRHLHVPLVHPTDHHLRHRRHHRPLRRRHHVFVQHRTGLPSTPPAQDPHLLDLHRHRPRQLPVDQPPRPPVLRDRHGTTDVSHDRPPPSAPGPPDA